MDCILQSYAPDVKIHYVCDICNETVRGPEHTYRCALVTTLGDKSLCCTVSDGLKKVSIDEDLESEYDRGERYLRTIGENKPNDSSD